jgi:hypothetical protein
MNRETTLILVGFVLVGIGLVVFKSLRHRWRPYRNSHKRNDARRSRWRE